VRRALIAVKATLDPADIINPGVLFNPLGHRVGFTGALGAT